jgi:hypothetical protein
LTVKVREGGRVINAVVLVATGVNADGRREVVGLRVAISETGAAWNSFCADLTARGLRTMNVNALTALLRVNGLGLDARKALTAVQITTVTRWRERDEPLEAQIARAEAIRLASSPRPWSWPRGPTAAGSAPCGNTTDIASTAAAIGASTKLSTWP